MSWEPWPFDDDITDAALDYAGVHSQFLENDFTENSEDKNNDAAKPRGQIFGEIPVSEKF